MTRAPTVLICIRGEWPAVLTVVSPGARGMLRSRRTRVAGAVAAALVLAGAITAVVVARARHLATTPSIEERL